MIGMQTNSEKKVTTIEDVLISERDAWAAMAPEENIKVLEHCLKNLADGKSYRECSLDCPFGDYANGGCEGLLLENLAFQLKDLKRLYKPRIYANWVLRQDAIKGRFYCSNCGYAADAGTYDCGYYYLTNHKYCPICGAEMKDE